ncbi:hypothetical protein ENBRE01_1109 [Enteropsectra breve]|nr:hypothetical protein ENBRE01_1109 [Enteropsectra breve]
MRAPMYEEIIAFLLGKKEEFTDDVLDEFIDLLVSALDVTQDYKILRKQALIESMVDTADLKDKFERRVVSDAIGNILHIETEEIPQIEEKKTVVKEIPLRNRKIVRGVSTKNESSDKQAASVAEKRNTADEGEESDKKRHKKDEAKEGTDNANYSAKNEDEAKERPNTEDNTKEEGLKESDKGKMCGAKPKVDLKALFADVLPKKKEDFKIDESNMKSDSQYKFDLGELESFHKDADGSSYEFDLSDKAD